MCKTSERCITQLAKMSIDPKFVELAADVFQMFLQNVSHVSILANSSKCTRIKRIKQHFFVSWERQ